MNLEGAIEAGVRAALADVLGEKPHYYPKGSLFDYEGDFSKPAETCAMCGAATRSGVKRHSGDAVWDAVCMDCANLVADAFNAPEVPPSPYWEKKPPGFDPDTEISSV